MTVDVICPKCGAARSVVVADDSDVHPPILCVACGYEYFLGESALPPVVHPVLSRTTTGSVESDEARPPRRSRRDSRRGDSPRELRRRAASRARTPALLLSLVAALQLCGHAAVVVVVLIGLFEPTAQRDPEAWSRGVLISALGTLYLVKDVVVLLGMRAMEQRRRYPLACAGAICGLIPDGCWLFSLVFAVWALIVLNDAEVNAAFADAPSPPRDHDEP